MESCARPCARTTSTFGARASSRPRTRAAHERRQARLTAGRRELDEQGVDVQGSAHAPARKRFSGAYAHGPGIATEPSETLLVGGVVPDEQHPGSGSQAPLGEQDRVAFASRQARAQLPYAFAGRDAPTCAQEALEGAAQSVRMSPYFRGLPPMHGHRSPLLLDFDALHSDRQPQGGGRQRGAFAMQPDRRGMDPAPP